MHIVHVVTRLLRAGSEENTVATCLWQAAAGHRVTLIHGGEADPSWTARLDGAVDLVALPSMVHEIRPAQDRRALADLRTLLARLRPDVVHTHQSKAGLLGRMAAGAVPSAAVVHGIHILSFEGTGRAKTALYVGLERWAARRTDLLIAVSRGVGRRTVEAGICRPGDVEVVPSGMDLGPFRDARPPADAGLLLDLPDGAPRRGPVLLMLAAFEPRKRHVPFLAAFRTLRERVPGAHLLLAGAGPSEPEARAASAALGLDAAVTFCGHRSDPAALVAMADLTVLASEREGLPRVAVQSLAGGVPVVATRVAGLDEIVAEGVNGHLADARLGPDLPRILGDVLLDPARLARLRSGARATDLAPWALDGLGRRTTDLYGLARERREARRAQGRAVAGIPA